MDFQNAAETLFVLVVAAVFILAWGVIGEDDSAWRVGLIFLGLCGLAGLALTLCWIWTA